MQTQPAVVPDDDEIRTLVTRLSRPHPSGGVVIERAAILAAGAGASAVLTWITAHDGQPEVQGSATVGRGLHSPRLSSSATDSRVPLRYVFPPGALAKP